MADELSFFQKRNIYNGCLLVDQKLMSFEGYFEIQWRAKSVGCSLGLFCRSFLVYDPIIVFETDNELKSLNFQYPLLLLLLQWYPSKLISLIQTSSSHNTFKLHICHSYCINHKFEKELKKRGQITVLFLPNAKCYFIRIPTNKSARNTEDDPREDIVNNV